MSGTGDFTTRSVHIGNGVDPHTGAIRRPLIAANSYRLPEDSGSLNWSDPDTLFYARNSSANQMYLQEKLANLEGAEDAVVLASGVSALAALLFTFLDKDSHVICSNVCYVAMYRLLGQYYPEKYDITTSFVDTSDLEEVKRHLRPNTRLIHIETPGNPTTRISDVQALAEIAHGVGALLSVDSTIATPYLQRPLEQGADLVVHSLTKYINGHGDAMGGAVLGSKALIGQIKRQAMVNLGGVISPFNAWMIMRGAATLPLRMERISQTALQVASYLETHPKVRFIAYPGLASHPQHDLARRTMRAYSGLMSFGLHADEAAHSQFIHRMRWIVPAVSLGHDESLIVYTGPNDERSHFYPQPFQEGFLRMSIGLESAEDLIADLQQALDSL